jgi:hypothetical protein
VVIPIIGFIALLMILSLIGVFSPSSISANYIELHYDNNGTATENLSNGEGAGSINVVAIVPYNSVIVSWAIPAITHTDHRTLALHTGESLENCAGKVTLRAISFSEASFEFKRPIGSCPICILQGIMMRMPDLNRESYNSTYPK